MPSPDASAPAGPAWARALGRAIQSFVLGPLLALALVKLFAEGGGGIVFRYQLF